MATASSMQRNLAASRTSSLAGLSRSANTSSALLASSKVSAMAQNTTLASPICMRWRLCSSRRNRWLSAIV
ncbi:hypothetical protein D3C81_1276380 [compost metagenome]